jgi:hypothetical protein
MSETRVQKKDRKRFEAEERNAATPHERTKAHRLGRCGCDSPAARLLRDIFEVPGASS